MKKTAFIIAAVLGLAILSVSAGGVLAIDGVDLNWNVIAGGGGSVQSASVGLQGTIGQPATGDVNSAGLAMCSGFWCPPPPELIYLPIIAR